MLAAIHEITLIFLVIAEDELSLSVLQVTRPVTLIYVTVGVFVNTIETLVVPEGTREGITVEEGKVSLDFRIITPCTLEDSAFTEIVSPLALLPSLFEITTVDVLISILQSPLSMRQVIKKPA
jgi:hypothetical protein